MFTIGCTTVYDVSYDYNTNIDLNALKTYNWLRLPEKEGIKNLDIVRIRDAVNGGLEAKSLMIAIENPDFLIAVYLDTKEKIKVINRGYDPYLGYYGYWPYRGYRGYGPHRGYRGHGSSWGHRKYAPHAGYRRYRPFSDYRAYGPYSGFGDYDPYLYGLGYGRSRVIQYEEGTLILDFIDPELREVIWQGSAKSYVDDSMVTEKREQLIFNAVQKILKNFPPAS